MILFALAGALLPQEGMFTPDEINRWQEAHPVVTSLFKPLELFRVFHSVPFLVAVLLLGINTLTCTVLRVVREGGFAAFKGPKTMRTTGFTVLHLSLIILFIGGGLTAGSSMDGLIIFTEGQVFTEAHDNYIQLVEGPLRKERHQGFQLRLAKVRVTYEGTETIGMAADVETREPNNTIKRHEIKVNYPMTYRGLAFTLNKTGYSPRVLIKEKKTGETLVHSFAALKGGAAPPAAKGAAPLRTYRDFLPLPVFLDRNERVILTLVPPADNAPPLMKIEIQNDTGETQAHGETTKNEIEVGDYLFSLTGLRQWASFRVVEDPGYDIILIALWLGLIGTILRYIPDIKEWF